LKKRLDQLLVDRGLAPTRRKAHALIMAGQVLVAGEPSPKAGRAVDADAEIQLKTPPHPYVSRGGLKIEGAARAFGIEVEGKTAVDVGASNGGFTHFLLRSGARHVWAVDVDTAQLDWTLRGDPRVTLVEVNARFLAPEHIGAPVDLAVVDVAFISATLVVPRLPPLLKDSGQCLVLVKPQFEAGRDRVGKGGIVRDPEDWKAAIERVEQSGQAAGFGYSGVRESPITGREGNREFFTLFHK
jgi:23S rRNA (cytidine1920-2'-O)/16S rRNA (cytidine1409-2'-O)-methyltransferase